MTIEVFTDGSCAKPRSPGGWAYVEMGVRAEIGYEPETTNQRMEMMAVLEAMRYYDRTPIRLTSDSAYCINGLTERWIDRWRLNGWRNAKRKPVANRDLWEPMFEVFDPEMVELVHVRGHIGVLGNEVADGLAKLGRLYQCVSSLGPDDLEAILAEHQRPSGKLVVL